MMKFKQKLALSLCTFYLVSVIGVALSMHFCGGKLASVAVYSSKAACKFCKAAVSDSKDNGCCKNTKVEVKVKDSHQSESSFKLPKVFNVESLLPSRAIEFVGRLIPKLFNKIENKAPPKSKGVAIHVFNCVFRN
jgi:hypothetical protein